MERLLIKIDKVKDSTNGFIMFHATFSLDGVILLGRMVMAKNAGMLRERIENISKTLKLA